MNRVGQVNNYEQWAEDANRGQDARLAEAAGSHVQAAQAAARAAQAAAAAQAQRLSDAQVDDRPHTYYYHPRSDTHDNSYYYYYYYPWARGGRSWPSRETWGWYDAYPMNDPRSHHHVWMGRTRNEVMADYHAYAMRHRNLGRAPRAGEQEWVPRNPRDDQMFWVKELDGGWSQRTSNTIENDLRPGYWTSYVGKPIFVRTGD